MTDNGYHKTLADHCVFVKKFEGGYFLIRLLYVDVMLIVGRDYMEIRVLKKALSRSFSMKDYHDIARLEPMTLRYMGRALDHYTICCNT